MGLSRITTLVTPATTYDLTDLPTVKDELNLPLTDTSNDDWLSRAITQVSGAIARYCNRSPAEAAEASFPIERVQDLFYPERDNYPYQVPGGFSPLQLSHYPITNMVSVVQTDPPGTDTQLNVSVDYVVNPGIGQLIRLDKFMAYPTTWAPVKITVIYDSGYNPIPADVVDATLRWVTNRWALRDQNPTLKSREQPGIGTDTFWVGGSPTTGGIPEDIADLLNPYRVPVVA